MLFGFLVFSIVILFYGLSMTLVLYGKHLVNFINLYIFHEIYSFKAAIITIIIIIISWTPPQLKCLNIAF